MHHVRRSAKQSLVKAIPLEDTNVNRATVEETRFIPFFPSHSLPPPVFSLFSNTNEIASVVVDSFIPLT